MYIIPHPPIKNQILIAVKFCGRINEKLPLERVGAYYLAYRLRIKPLRNPLPYPCPLPKAQTGLPFPELQEF